MTNNNPFTNNRFHFLDEDNSDKFKSVKKEKKTESYDSSNNSFTKESQRINDSRRYSSFNSFRSNKTSDIIKEVKTFNIEETNFPEIQENIKTMKQSTSDSFKFKDALNKQKDIILNTELEENKIKPGWVEISLVNGKTVFKEGPLTPYMIQQQEKEEYENTPHYIMNTAITSMRKGWKRYIDEYNSIHGEGSYEELYVLPPVYGPEYDSEEEADDSNDSDNSGDL